jgi:hypothetical protein
MNFERKQQQLDQLYDIYASLTESLDLACRKYCCRCCTRNVTLTSLEAASILDRLDPIDSDRLVEKIRSAAALARFQPRITTNEMAERCMRGEPLPEEPCDPRWGPCPLLEEQSCPLYALRPFACRCLISQSICEQTGYADIDEFSLTVNSVFLQVIEHLDRDGCTGNFSDVILYLSESENMSAYRQGRLECAAGGLIGNQPVKVLMIPPDHRRRAAPLLSQLQRLGLT